MQFNLDLRVGLDIPGLNFKLAWAWTLQNKELIWAGFTTALLLLGCCWFFDGCPLMGPPPPSYRVRSEDDEDDYGRDGWGPKSYPIRESF